MCDTNDPKPAIDYEFIRYNNYWYNNREYNKIMNRLYLGSDSPVKDVNVMTTLEISLVISVTEEPVPEESRWPNISYQHIEAGDFPDEDLISHFDHCYRLIAKAHEKDETVYIHCRSGTSRSATIVMAFLMKKHCISYLNSRKRVEKKRKVFPNEGFVHQLELYERMNFFANGYNQEYRRFLLKSLTYKLRSNGLSLGLTNNLQSKSPKATSRAERDMKFHYEYNCLKNYFKKIVAAEQTGDQFYDSTDTGPVYTCYYCNHELFNQINIITEKVSDYSCRDLFIEPLQTYCTQSDDETSGYLKCPNCMRIFGTYNWRLYECNCCLHHNCRECLALKVFWNRIFYKPVIN